MSVTIKGDSSFDAYIVSGIKDWKTEHVKFKNISFNCKTIEDAEGRIFNLISPAQPEPHEIGYYDCSNALLKMWMDNVLTDREYYRIADKLNEKWGKTELPESFKGVTECLNY